MSTAPKNSPGQTDDLPRTWRILDLIQWGEAYFHRQGVENARMETEWLLAHVLSLQRVDLYVQFDRLLTAEELATFKGLIKRRTKGEPFQYILGRAPFYGRDFKVTPAVMIPRPETEVIIQVLRRGPEPNSILDVGTGCGCLAITAALHYPRARVLAVDISAAALGVAEENARLWKVANVTFQELDILTAIPEDSYEVVLCNPPYVATEEMAALPREIRAYEPETALTDGTDGLTFFHRLVEIGTRLLQPGGRLLMELGRSVQAKPVREIFSRAGAEIEVYPDLQGDPRIAAVRWRSGPE